MKYLDLTFPTPEENLACDEALLERSENGEPCEILRVWEPRSYFVVVGYSNKVEREVNVRACKQHGIPILRRISGGGTVLQGPGCLNFSLILRISGSALMRSIPGSNAFILKSQKGVLQPLAPASIEISGTDLTIRGRKFSGSAQRRKKSFLLFHGTLLLNFDLALIEKLLPLPSKQPDYRKNRSHQNFLFNLGLPGERIKDALKTFWDGSERLDDIPSLQIQNLSKKRYSDAGWNFKL